jgi:Mor family transcriptional regulator
MSATKPALNANKPTSTEFMAFPPEYPEVMAQVCNIIFRQAVNQLGVDAACAKEFAFSTTEQVRADMGGAMLYFPRGLSYTLSQRDEEIYKQWLGHNFKELATRYHLTEQQIRNVVKRGRLRDRARRQQKLDF